MNSLLKEMGRFAQLCSSENYSKLETMKQKSDRVEKFYMNLPDLSINSWYLLYKLLALLQAHSCTAERGFAVLSKALTNKCTLRDVVEARLMMRFNKERNIAMDYDSYNEDDNDSVHSDNDNDVEKNSLSGSELDSEGSSHGNDVGKYGDRNDFEESNYDDDDKNNSFESAEDPVLGDITNSIEKLKLPATNEIIPGEKTGITLKLFTDEPDTDEKIKLIRCCFCQKICTTQFDKSLHEKFCKSDPAKGTAEIGIQFQIELYIRL
jgi:hypothetical protein